jgi:hypothetical protein
MLAGVDCCRDHALRLAFAVASVEEDLYGGLPSDTLQELIKRSQVEDPTAKEVHQALALPQNLSKNRSNPRTSKVNHYRGTWEEIDSLLYCKKRLYVPPSEDARTKNMWCNHDHPITGNFAAQRTLELVARKYYWPGFEKDVLQHTDTCATCAQSKSRTHKLYVEAQSLPTPTKPWTDISLDFIVGLPKSRRTTESQEKNAILVVVNRLTKMVRYFAVTDKIDVPKLAKLLVHKVVLKGAGIPDSTVSDRGPQLTSNFWSASCFYLRIRCRMSSAYHPQTDRQTEWWNWMLEWYLGSYVNYRQDNWVKWLPLAKFAYNNSVHESTGVTPYFAWTGHHLQREDTL